MDKITQLINLPLACEYSAFETFTGTMLNAIKSGATSDFEKQVSKELKTIAYVGNTDTLCVSICNSYDANNGNLPDNSIVVIYLDGIIFPWRILTIEETLQQASANPKVIGVLLFVSTPGGYAMRVDLLNAQIKSFQKPIAAYITGLCCSAGQWIVSGCDRIFSASPTDIHGSIGTMQFFYSAKKYYDGLGIVSKEIYATNSTEKNYATRSAEDGNYGHIIENLDFLNTLFHKHIAENRNIEYDKNSPVFTGKDFRTEQAIKLKLCDEIADLYTALEWVLKEGLRHQANHLI